MDSFTCLVCPNGCGLSVTREEDHYKVKGNRCYRGEGYARREYAKKGMEGSFISAKPFPHYTREELKLVMACWEKPLEEWQDERFVQGSPERSLFRTVTYSGKQPLILEQIEPKQAEKHERTARRLAHMKKNGLPVSPFIQGRDGHYIQNVLDRNWQLTPFVQGRPFNRNNYWKDSWRGKALGDFICRLYQTERPDAGEPLFDLVGFINELIEKIALNHGALLPRLVPVLNRLEETVFPVCREMAVVFGHGDPHPLNIIWGDDRILSLIDWEFCGTKPLLYDASLIMGCVGSEAPDAFDGPFNQAFYRCLKNSQLFPTCWLKHLPSFILAQRFAWLNEWLRHEDEAMLNQELSYMEMLL